MITRRTLLHGAAGTFAGAALARPAKGAIVEFQELPSGNDDRLKMLVTTAVDAAMAAGAKYVDARLTFTQKMTIRANAFTGAKTGGIGEARDEQMHFGVRAQYDGYWGFASSPVWTKEEAARLGRDVVNEAKANVLGKPRDAEMAPNPAAKSGDWSMPVTDDAFEIDPDEIFDYLSGLQKYISNLNFQMNLGQASQIAVFGHFIRQQKAFGSSDGQFVTQRLYRTGGDIGFIVGAYGASAGGPLSRLSWAGLGFEYIRHAQIREWVRQHYEELAEEQHLPIVPIDVGRYLTLIHPTAVADLLKQSVGVATEIDRVMGYEANAGGTSYIVDPNEMLGSLKIGSTVMNVTGTRSQPGGLSNVKWDDEGIEPNDFKLVTDGILTSLQTNREGAAWMKSYSEKTAQPFRSHGCSYGTEASDPQMVHPADLILHPDPSSNTTIDDLRAQMDKGIEVKYGTALMDFQQSTGLMVPPVAFEIRRGKRVGRIASLGMIFRTSELWGNMQAVGGASSVQRIGTSHMKGEPTQLGYSSVDTPPAVFKDMSVINPTQKA